MENKENNENIVDETINLKNVRQSYYDDEKKKYILTIEDDVENTIYIKALKPDDYFNLINNSKVKNCVFYSSKK